MGTDPITAWFDGGAGGRVLVADSLSYFEGEARLNDVAVGASFAGAPTAAMAMRPGVKAWIAHEGGPGKDDAGVSGLALAQRFGIPAAAIATMTAGLSRGKPCNLHGIIDESIHEVEITPAGKVFGVWSFSRVEGEHPNDVF